MKSTRTRHSAAFKAKVALAADEGRPLAIGLQEQIANHRKRLGSKALVVSVAEKVP